MPRKKKKPITPDYEGLPRHEELLLVQKSNPLQSLAQTSMTLPEFKILDVYLSRIDSHDEEKRFVRFEKGELEGLLGVERIRKEDLDARLKNLFQSVKIVDPEKPKGFIRIGLFERAEAVPDENGLWQVDLACTPSALEYVFNIEHLGYLKYRLRSVINLTSRYSYILFIYLEDNRYRKEWEIGLEDLKKILRVTGASYEKYKELNDKILKRAQAELHEKTELRFAYEPVRKGRSTVGVKFRIETKSDQLSLEDVYPDAMAPISAERDVLSAEEARELDQAAYNDKLDFYREAVDGAFTRDEVAEVVARMWETFAYGDYARLGENPELLCYSDLRRFFLKFKADTSGKKITYPYRYFRASLNTYMHADE